MDRRNGQRLAALALVPVASLAFGTGTASAAPISSGHTAVLAQGYGGNGDGNGDGNGFDLNGLLSPFQFGGRGSSGSAGSGSGSAAGGMPHRGSGYTGGSGGAGAGITPGTPPAARPGAPPPAGPGSGSTAGGLPSPAAGGGSVSTGADTNPAPATASSTAARRGGRRCEFVPIERLARFELCPPSADSAELPPEQQRERDPERAASTARVPR